MNNRSRTYNTALNASVNILVQFVTLIINFATRKIFIVTFGENYLGISGLYSNILSVLSLAELGVGSAILYCMYKPVAEKDFKKISALVNYYKKLYRVIGFSVAVIGLAVVPFLKYLVKIEADIGNITLYYLLYLTNVVSSYFLVYKTSILTADQKNYIIKICTAVIQIIQFIVLTVIAFLIKNYTVYLAAHIGFSVITNYVCSRIAVRKYPFIVNSEKLSDEEKRSIWKNIQAMFSYQIGNVAVNNTDNILISVMVNTVMVGYYSNYSMVISAVSTFVMLLFTSTQASIGNLAAQKDENRQYDIFKKISAVSFCVTSFSVVSFVALFQDFITIMYTSHYLLDFKTVLVCALNFYLVNILYPIYCFRNTVGLFRNTKMIMVYTAVINIILSVILGKICGLFGILIATSISRICTNFWYEPIKLYKIYFKKNVSHYFLKQLKYFLLTVLMTLTVIGCSCLMVKMNIYIRFVLKILICILLSLAVFYAMYGKTEFFISIKESVRNKITRVIKKIN